MAQPTTGPAQAFITTLSLSGFQPLVDEDAVSGGPYSTYQSITALAEYRGCSFEDLRLNDYMRGGQPRQSTFSSAHLFTSASLGLVTARMNPTLPYSRGSRRQPTYYKRTHDANIIAFRVGKEETSASTFYVHSSLITPRSNFVRTAIEKGWKEAQDRIIELPDDEPAVFEVYEQYLYTQRIYTAVYPNTSKESATEYSLLVKAYALGEKLLDSYFKDVIIDCIIEKLRESGEFDPHLSRLVYENTPSHSPLRHLWCDIYVWAGSANWLSASKPGTDLEQAEGVHPEFSFDLNKIQMGFWQGQRPTQAPYETNMRCHYHEHLHGDCYWSSAEYVFDAKPSALPNLVPEGGFQFPSV